MKLTKVFFIFFIFYIYNFFFFFGEDLKVESKHFCTEKMGTFFLIILILIIVEQLR